MIFPYSIEYPSQYWRYLFTALNTLYFTEGIPHNTGTLAQTLPRWWFNENIENLKHKRNLLDVHTPSSSEHFFVLNCSEVTVRFERFLLDAFQSPFWKILERCRFLFFCFSSTLSETSLSRHDASLKQSLVSVDSLKEKNSIENNRKPRLILTRYVKSYAIFFEHLDLISVFFHTITPSTLL